MATATFSKFRVTTAAHNRIIDLLQEQVEKTARKNEARQQRIIEAQKPKWWRPWSISLEKAEYEVSSERCLYGFVPRELLDPHSDQIQNLRAIIHLCNKCDGEVVTLTEGESILVFGAPKEP